MKKIRIAAIAAALIGLGVSLYLAYGKLAHKNLVCIKNMGDCNIVNSSSYSEWRGIPIALVGSMGYLIILFLLTIYRNEKMRTSTIPLTLFCLTLFGTSYSIYLTYLEIFVIHAICSWCLVSAIAMGILLIVSIMLLRNSNFMKNIL